ncbi:PASTA domain-containing protein [Sediminispirochaeta smaragdinae]|jgi:beta-lactam-binding protein with PASTA domain|uniref:PASTA domain containing protein n=1 Tax=Sediminispirochaeta smaragdinae (strain DSM 11293 / JCM 15392 / SEBR 4228) TaxID=573413 RepID=E1R618_SEDSS|nr:PASTA domain-containing protein [Sediminispirochaeta smaragdinae]ADK80783.1 PASTA domain containing protein [Sediminispirochaeta smaragdinae DSM 11293]
MSVFGFRKRKKEHGENQTDPEQRYLRFLLFFGLAAVVLMLIITAVTFMLTLDAKEETMVPDLVGMPLENAMLSLQEKALNAGIQLRYSNALSDKGMILGQDPGPGTFVKAGTRVVLRVSKGKAVEKLDNYVGWNISELESHLKSLETVYGPLLRLKKPFVRVFSEEPAGTILEQKPEPGTELSALTDLELVVSKGAEGELITVGDYIGIDWERARDIIAGSGLPFVFTLQNDAEGRPGTVVGQNPAAGAEVPVDTIRQLIILEPDNVADGYQFGMVERSLPDYPVPVPVQVEAILPNGTREEIVSLRHSGGLLSIPYEVPDDTTIVVNVNGEEVLRQRVQGKD